MADLILVLDGSRLAEAGSHDELMARRGPYAELYGIQAAAYRPEIVGRAGASVSAQTVSASVASKNPPASV